jgi:hypothetical protein
MSRTSIPIGIHLSAWAAVWCVLLIVLAGDAAAPQEVESTSPAVPNEDASQAPPLTQQPAPAEPPKKQEVTKPAGVSRLLIVVGPLAAVAALMGLYWLILRQGAV